MGPFERLRLWLGGIAVAVWVITIGFDIFDPSYDPPQSVQLVVLLVAGSLFTPTIVKKANGVVKKNGE